MSAEGCLAVVQPLAALSAGIGSQSDAVSWADATAGHLLTITEQADQFQLGDATRLMRNLAFTTTESAVAGLGSQAVRIKLTMKFADATEFTQVLWVRYGDVVVGVSYLSVDIAKARSFDLAAKANQIAANLKLL